MPKFKACLEKISKDREGEVKLVLMVSQTEAKEAWDIPEQKQLEVTIEIVL